MKINLLCYHCGSVLIIDAPAKEIEKIESEFLKAHSQCYPAQLKSSTKREKSGSRIQQKHSLKDTNPETGFHTTELQLKGISSQGGKAQKIQSF